MRRGSALLIVLGMLSFMVVSAVGFSVYMRQSRLPSSYLRRNAAARYLVKGALALAIEELEGAYNGEDGNGNNPIWGGITGGGDDDNDDYTLENHFYGVYDDPFPGCGPDNDYAGSDPKKNGDFWLKRVFCPFGPVTDPQSESDVLNDNKVSPTVPTLTLEALAYLPPAIADDVRKVSRLTRTACWRSLPYDAGRYAYTAVNVSDLFDINRLQVAPRDSGANRISLAALGVPASEAESVVGEKRVNLDSLDTAVAKWMSLNPKTPYVSLADFALVNAGNDYSPFTKFVGGSGGGLLSGSSVPEANALFITDSWFPPPPDQTVYDLAGAHQPFSDFTADEILKVSNMENKQDNAGKVFEQNLGNGLACLYDYLDSNSQPISLAFPTTEAVPMIVAVGAPEQLQPQMAPPAPADKTVTRTLLGKYTYNVTRTVTKHVIASFSPSKPVVNVSLMYPFKRMKQTGRNSLASFSVRGVLRIFAVPVGSTVDTSTRLNVAGLRPDAKPLFAKGAKSYARGVASFASDPVTVSFSDDNLKQKDNKWIQDVQLMFDTDNMNIPVLNHVEETWTLDTAATPDPTGAPTPSPAPANTFDGLGGSDLFCPVGADGSLVDVATWLNGADLAKDISEPGSSGGSTLDNVTVFTPSSAAYKLYAAVWVQVTDGGEKVFDMAPACAADDELWLDTSGGAPSSIIGEGTPLLDFATDYGAAAGFAIDEKLDTTFASVATYNDTWTALYAVDPRFNYAPENWFFRKDGNTGLGAKWITALGANDTSGEVFGREGRDRDVFMFVSDQEYLQDIGELQFLPALYDGLGPNASASFISGSAGFAAGMRCDGRKYVDGSTKITMAMLENNKNDGTHFADGTFFWRTYTAYDNGDGYADVDSNHVPDIYQLGYSGFPNGIRFHSGAEAFRLNPYSRDDRVLAAAFAGTPFDYYVASTKDDQLEQQNKIVKEIEGMTYEDMVKKYAFGSSSQQAKVSDTQMADILDVVRGQLAGYANSGKRNWIQAWSDLMWQDAGEGKGKVGDDNDTFFADDIKPDGILHGVDRKFLYSYWRECFDNRQQLFLIFVRAEPTAIGGGASGSLTSAQLGGRAVALVWRDPEIPSYNAGNRVKDGEIKNCTYSRDKFRGSGDSARRQFRDMKKNLPPHRTRVLFYHQFD